MFTKQEKFGPLANSAAVLATKKVAIVGLGGLGSHAAEYITRMGIGHVVLIDDDLVEQSNLARQGVYTYEDSLLPTFKSQKMESVLRQINPIGKRTTFTERLQGENIDSLLEGVDLVLDGTDNLSTRYLLNDYCYAKGIPWIYASATASVGTVVNFIPGKTPCFRCVYGNETDEDNASCDINGVILPILTSITSLQVTEALKILLDKDPSTEEIRYNIWTREESSVDTSIFLEETCVCQTGQVVLETSEAMSVRFLCGGDSIQVLTPFDVPFLTNKMINAGFQLTRKNEVLAEGRRGEKERFVAYKTGKMMCYHMDKETTERLFHC